MLKTYAFSLLGQCSFLSAFAFYLWAMFGPKGANFALKGGSLSLIMSYFILTIGFINSDFSLKVVADHSSTITPLMYKIVGVWGSSEGSYLLWNTLLGLSGFVIKNIKAQRLFAFHMAGFLIVSYLVLFPFETVVNLTQGQDLNPLLQDHAMVLHPPILYASQVLLGTLFFKTYDQGSLWPTIRCGFFLSTLGILLGSMWAYYELGWGGFWFWDSVEVISLFSWLFYAMAYHAHIKGYQAENLLRFGWLITLIGVGLVRSGVLQSVHSFAQDPTFGFYFGIVVLLTVVLPLLMDTKIKLQINQHSMLFFVWITILFILILSVLIPVFFPSICFTPRFYQASIWPISLILVGWLIFMRGNKQVFKGLFFLLLSLIFFDDGAFNILSAITLSLCVIGMVKYPFSVAKELGHIGFYIFLISSVVVSFKSTETLLKFEQDKTEINIHHQTFKITDVKSIEEQNYVGHQVTITADRFEFKPTLKYYPTAQKTHSDMVLQTSGLNQYAAIIESMDAQHIHIRYYIKKGILGVWLGVALMLMGILMCVRYKIKKPS